MDDQTEIHRMTMSEDVEERREAIVQLRDNFVNLPDKKRAWEDLIRLTSDADRNVRRGATYALGTTISNMPDKILAWDDLHRLIFNTHRDVRAVAAYAIGIAFSYIPDKKMVWDDLHRLTSDTDMVVRRGAADGLGSAFSHVSDKKQALNDLHRLTFDIDSGVRRRAAEALGSAFAHVPDKNLTCDDLHRLTSDSDCNVRASAYHSLGKSSIFKAANAENDMEFKKEMEAAIGFFENSSQQVFWSQPAKFCLPFYRSFYALIFKNEETEAEVQKYIAEAKRAIEGSESKEKLIEAVENLGNALKEAQKARDFNDIKADLNAYRRYCDRACELLDTTEDKAPGASRLIRRGMPIIDERIKGIISEIQEKAWALCKKTKGTSFEEIGLETVKSTKELKTDDIIKIYQILENISNKLNKFCEYLPDDEKKSICGKIRNSRNLDVIEQAETIDQGFDYILLHFPIPPIITIPTINLNKQKQSIVRIAAIQLGFKLTNSFPPTLEEKAECKQKIISALDTAKSSGAHIACLPELCMCEEWMQDIKDRYPDMIIIGGSFYKNDFNECPVIMNLEVPPQLKKSPSRFEDPEITGRGMKSGDKLYRYETQFGSFSVLVCIDFLNFAKFCDQTDIIFCPSYNEAKGIERFHEYANSHVTNTPSYIIISNTALFGGTSIFGQLHRDYYRGLVENGCKKGDDDSYKLCDLEKGFEGIIIADFDMVHKSSQVPTPADSSKVIKSIKNIKKIKISE